MRTESSQMHCLWLWWIIIIMTMYWKQPPMNFDTRFTMQAMKTYTVVCLFHWWHDMYFCPILFLYASTCIFWGLSTCLLHIFPLIKVNINQALFQTNSILIKTNPLLYENKNNKYSSCYNTHPISIAVSPRLTALQSTISRFISLGWIISNLMWSYRRTLQRIVQMQLYITF